MGDIGAVVDFLRARLCDTSAREGETVRRVVAAWEHAVDNERTLGVPGRISYESGKVAAAELAVRILADGWRDHPDYQPAWGVRFVRAG